MKHTLLAASLLAVTLSGCMDLFSDEDHPFDRPLADMDFHVDAGDRAAADIDWPDFTGANLTILSHGAFAAFDTASARFTQLTGAQVHEVPADDTGSALNRAALDAGDAQFDILYGIDNILLQKALDAGIFEPYTPRLGGLIEQDHVFFDLSPWPATPVDHGYIALNVDADHPLLDATEQEGCDAVADGRDVPAERQDGNVSVVRSLADVRALACLFVTQNPNLSTPGLGFLLMTIDAFGEDDAYDWVDYWQELLRGPDGEACTGDETKITSGWSEAYENHFPGGYGNADWNSAYVGGYPIVTSYTESPAYEAYFGSTDVAEVPLQAGAFHQIQTMGILAGTKQLAVAQAWIEFTLTDDFQNLAAAENAVYPVTGLRTDDVYGDVDPEPGTFATVALDWHEIGSKLDGWLDTWQQVFEDHSCTV